LIQKGVKSLVNAALDGYKPVKCRVAKKDNGGITCFI